MRRTSLGFLAVCASAVAACGGTTSNGANGADGGTLGATGATDATTPITSLGSTPLPCDVEVVLNGHCRSCHQSPPVNAAPMPLMTWEDTQRAAISDPSKKVYQLMETRIHDDRAPMPQLPNARLGTTDTATIDEWVAAGAPRRSAGDACVDAGTIPDAAPPPLSCNTDLTFAPKTPWQMPTTQDDQYVCYGYDAPAGSIPAGTVRHVLGITPNVVNHSIVHHVLLYQAESSFSPTPQPCSAGGSLQWRVVYGWAPGGGAMQTPPNVGFPYDGTTHWVVQVHYNNVNHLANQSDTSGFALCTTDQPVANDADVVAFGTQSISIPPHSTLDQTCSITVPSMFGGLHFFSAFPHLHQLGTAIETKLFPAGGGAPVDMGTNVPWNFNNQLWFPVSGTINTGDVVKTRCAWNNTTDATVSFGQNTENEMCYSFTAYYPKVQSSLWSWALPALQSSCSTTPDGGI
jgi:hypothetical protein